jgi:hypothetical protein
MFKKSNRNFRKKTTKSDSDDDGSSGGGIENVQVNETTESQPQPPVITKPTFSHIGSEFEETTEFRIKKSKESIRFVKKLKKEKNKKDKPIKQKEIKNEEKVKEEEEQEDDFHSEDMEEDLQRLRDGMNELNDNDSDSDEAKRSMKIILNSK